MQQRRLLTPRAAGRRANAGCCLSGQAGTGCSLLLASASSSSSLRPVLQDRVVPEVPALAKGEPPRVRLDEYRASSSDRQPGLALEELSHAKK